MPRRVSGSSDGFSRQPLHAKLLRFFSQNSFPRPTLFKASPAFSASAPNLDPARAESVGPRGILRKQMSSSSSEDPSSPPTSYAAETDHETDLEPSTMEAMAALPLQQQTKALLRQIGAMDMERNMERTELEAKLHEWERKYKDADRKLREIQGPQGRRGSSSSTQSDDGRLGALQAELTFQQAQGVSRQEVLHKLLELEETRTQQLLQWNEERSALQSSITALSIRNFQLEGQVAQFRESELDLQVRVL
ncbi:uncharacterized protein EV422DRAFT_312986 [Fimicolochytrium jonesii]|uniref:uncharacterized protein n=1 Tax=Fimicolochytrium jonesii TaxID=1396493 RepID=UPI0022FDC8DF|nr:uncharacterized protein EV422DRAFT_312986 [Fimicolochytrium jonesii]KAI8824255.1 hypothetical protein EV422DRAFT_312986 [Fimicolochytrium jonesii]